MSGGIDPLGLVGPWIGYRVLKKKYRLYHVLCLLQFIRAKKAVVSNASMWDTLKLLPQEVVPKSYSNRINTTSQCESFMHLHLGFDAEVRFL